MSLNHPAGPADKPTPPVQARPAQQRRGILLAGTATVIALTAGLLLGRGLHTSAAGVTDPVSLGFLRDMKTHHAQAVEMSAVIHRREPQPDLNYLAEDILTTQQGQIGIMMGLLTLSDQSQSTGGSIMGWMGPEHAGHMPGMASDQDIAALKTGPLDRTREQYLRLMIRHHRGAIPMADFAAEHAQSPHVAQLAAGMVSGQAAEIQAMQNMLGAAGLPPEPENDPSDPDHARPSGTSSPTAEPEHSGHNGD